MEASRRTHLDHLRDRIRQSRYQVDARAVAGAILDRIAPEVQRLDGAAMPARPRPRRRA